MKLSRTVSYALQATLRLAESGSKQPVPCSRLATEGGMPERFLLQILRNLVSHGVLQSTRGVDGGYMLHKPAADISLLQVIEAVDGPMISSLPVADGIHPESRRKLEELLAEVTQQVRDRLSAVCLSDLIPGGNRVLEERAQSGGRDRLKPRWIAARDVTRQSQ